MHRIRWAVVALLALVIAPPVAAQSTGVVAGDSLPASCTYSSSQSRLFYLRGDGLYACSATNTWTRVATSIIGNAFFAVTGPTTSIKTFTFPNANATVLTDNAAVTVSQGGTGAAPASDDQVLVSSSSSAAAWKTLPACNSGNNAVQYDTSTNAWSCATITGGGGGGVGTVTNSGTLTSGAFIVGNGSADITAATTEVLPGANGGGLVFLAHQTASNSSSLDFTTRDAGGAIIQSDFETYVVELEDILPVSAADLWYRVSTNGGSSFDSGTNYGWTGFKAGAQGTLSQTGIVGADSGQTINLVTHALSNTSTNPTSCTMKLLNPNSSAYKTTSTNCVGLKSDNHFYLTNTVGMYLSATPVNAFRFLMSTGNISSGTIRVYGVAKQ